MLAELAFWVGVAAGSLAGMIAGVGIGIRLYLRSGRW